MCFFAVCNAYAMRSCLSIAITEMTVPIKPDENISADETCPSENLSLVTNETETHRGTYEWNEYTQVKKSDYHHFASDCRVKFFLFSELQGLILSSFYWGYVVNHIPGGIIADRYGGKHTLGIGILLTAIFTLLTPVTVVLGDYLGLIILRVLMGFGEGTTFPAINVLLAQWIPPEERSRAGSFVFTGCLIGTILATFSSGLILRYSGDGWPIVFYTWGIISVIWFLVWIFLCYNTPKDHPFISEKEVMYLNEHMGDHVSKENSEVPWRYILTSKPLWAVVIALLGHNSSMLAILTDLPKYMSGVLKFSVEYNSYVSSVIYFFTWVGSMIGSFLADYLIANKILSITIVRKFGATLALSGSAIFIIVASYAGCDKYLVIGMFVVAMAIMGLAFPSIMINALDLSPNYAGSLMAMTNGISALSGIGSPYIIGILTTNQTLYEWRQFFWILLGLSLSSNVIFLLFGSGEVQAWNDPEFDKENSRKK